MPLVDHLTTQVVDVEGGAEYSAAAADPSGGDIVSLELDGRDGEGGLMDSLSHREVSSSYDDVPFHSICSNVHGASHTSHLKLFV